MSINILFWGYLVHQGSFQLLAIINKAVEHVSLLYVAAYLDLCRGVVYLRPQLILCPIIWGTARQISRVVVPLCNPTNNGGVFLWLVWGRISGLFWFAFPWLLRMLNISLGASWPFKFLQLRIHYLALYPIFNRVIWLYAV